MVLDHFSGPISHYLYQCFGFFSAAEGFFFLSGFVGMLAVISKTSRGENSCWMLRRASRIWIYHILSVLALALAAFFFFPKIRHFFSGLYEHPLGGSTLAATLIYTPEWLDVLPLYVILLAIGFFALPQIARGRLKQVWAISFLIWIFAQGPLRSTFLQFVPHWAYPGFFDFFCLAIYLFLRSSNLCALEISKISTENKWANLRLHFSHLHYIVRIFISLAARCAAYSTTRRILDFKRASRFVAIYQFPCLRGNHFFCHSPQASLAGL